MLDCDFSRMRAGSWPLVFRLAIAEAFRSSNECENYFVNCGYDKEISENALVSWRKLLGELFSFLYQRIELFWTDLHIYRTKVIRYNFQGTRISQTADALRGAPRGFPSGPIDCRMFSAKHAQIGYVQSLRICLVPRGLANSSWLRRSCHGCPERA